MHAIKYASKGITAGIGAASEVVADIKNKRAGKDDEIVSEGLDKVDDDDDSIASEDLDDDEAEWALDEATAEMETNEQQYDQAPDTNLESADGIASSFLTAHSLGKSSRHLTPLPQPVILPQRRPKTLSRGFVRGYAPILDECTGIDQKTFIDFLESFDKASKASPVFDVVNLAALGVGLIPSPITGLTMGVSIAVQFASNTGKEIQSRFRRNTYLDNINEQLFKPRGLYCMIMTFKPDNPFDRVVEVNVSDVKSDMSSITSLSPAQSQGGNHDATSVALSKSISPSSDNKLRQKLKKMRLTSGASTGELSLLESAPLVYPAIDAIDDAASAGHSDQSSGKKQNVFKSSSIFLDSYLDRRAQARWAAQHPSSKLASMAPPSEKKFVNRFADPNHPVHSGTIIGPLTGGRFDPVADLRAKHAQWRARRRGVELTEEEVWNARMGRSTAVGRLGRILRRDVLYMIITNMPSEEEIKETNETLDKQVKDAGAPYEN